ncbi:MAG: glycyl-radical enzyme activating protein [Eubacteriales bacterium]
MKAIMFNIQRMSVHDGPGIRTTVFVKGCPLDCLWCHNPESKSKMPVIAYNKVFCTDCGECIAVCRRNCHSFSMDEKHIFRRNDCISCGDCAAKCSNGALVLAGKEMSCDEIMDIVLRDRKFYKSSGGGLTVSGGEPMLHADFTYALLSAAKKEGLHTCMESSLYCDFSDLKRIIPYTDIFLADFKENDDSLHKKFTGVGNGLIKENIRRLCENNVNIILRCPIIPGFNDRADHYNAVIELANTYQCISEIHLEPYNRLGEGKYEIFHLIPNRQIVGDEDDYIINCKNYISEKVQKPVILLNGN